MISLNYSDSILSVASAQNVANTLDKVIHDVLSRPDQLVSHLDPFTQRDFDRIQRWNLPSPDKINACVHELVLQHAKDSPESPAVCSWNGNLSYGDLEKSSLPLMQHLVSLGVGPEILVPICFKKSMFAIVSMIAILRAGGAFVPLDPSHPQDRIDGIIKKANAKLVMASPETEHVFEGLAASILSVSQQFLKSLSLQGQAADPVAHAEPRPDNAAFVLFTSGSTGKPKGIIQEHASVCTSSIAHGRALHMSSQSRVLQYAAYTFDVSMMDIFTTLICGGCVCVPSEEDRMSGIADVMNRMQVNWVLFTPSVASLIAPEDTPHLQTLVLGGEAVTRDNINCWAGKVQLLNCYGPAECAASTVGALNPGDMTAGIGKAFGCGLCWVTDPLDHNRLVPIGAVGELLVEGPTLARGYIDDIEKTRAAFIKNPKWASKIGSGRPRRIYKTGDLVRQNADGSFEFVGRKDFQLKMRGQRVELGEIEHHLTMYPGVALSIVASPQSGPFSKALVAVIQLRLKQLPVKPSSTTIQLLLKSQLETARFCKDEIKTYLKAKLPSYMIPNYWLVVENIPLSASGKTDRKFVEAWLMSSECRFKASVLGYGFSTRELPAKDTVALQISEQAAAMAAGEDDQLHVALRNRDFSFADAGLDSVQLMSLSMFIQKQYGVRLPIANLTNPTASVQNIAQYVKDTQERGSSQEEEKGVNVMEEFRQCHKEILSGLSKNGVSPRNVLVTGATGFLGTQILFRLCALDDIHKVIVHVRAENAEHGLQRIIKSAVDARWWSDIYLDRIEVWTGDLAKPRLGLAKEHWDRVCGSSLLDQCVTCVIHNGATVRWNADFSTLKATNVGSTLELLKAASRSPLVSKFVYVSGGQQLRPDDDDDRAIAEEVARSNGYAQTKFLSELLVKEFSRSSSHNLQRVSIVKPGYIIGTVRDGIVSRNDFIWRLTASSLGINGYNSANADAWLYLADVDRVAGTIVGCCDNKGSSVQRKEPHVVKILDGMKEEEFWRILKDEFGHGICPMDEETWLCEMRKDIESKGEKHVLWPLIPTIEKERGKLGSPRSMKVALSCDQTRLKAAVRRNIEYLSSVEFLPPPENEGMALDPKPADSKPILQLEGFDETGALPCF